MFAYGIAALHRLPVKGPGGLFPFPVPPGPAPNPAGQHVVFQLVRLILADPGKARAQIPKHRIVAKIPVQHLQGRPNQLQHGIEKHGPGYVHKHGDSVIGKHPAHVFSVNADISRDQRRIPVPVPACAHQMHNRPGRGMRLLHRVSAHGKRDCLLSLPIDLSVKAQHMALQKIQGRGLGIPGTACAPQQYRILYGDSALPGQPHQGFHGLPGGIKQGVLPALFPGCLPYIHGHRHRHLPGKGKQRSQEL